MMKYINNIGQNTGTSKTGKKVMEKATIKLFADLTQNLNSGSFRTKGLQRERGRKNEEGQYGPYRGGRSNDLKIIGNQTTHSLYIAYTRVETFCAVLFSSSFPDHLSLERLLQKRLKAAL